MNIYVESNFVLELALMQEEHESCDAILALCEIGKAQLIIPAYSLAEPHETLIRRDKDRKQLAETVRRALRELGRSTLHKTDVGSVDPIVSLLIRSGEADKQSFSRVRNRFFQTASIIPLDKEVLSLATAYEQEVLAPQDAIVFASVLKHLEAFRPVKSCFLNRNAKDFADPNILDTLADKYSCKFFSSFQKGYEFIESQVK